MRRREFITLLGGAAASPLPTNAQQAGGRIYRIGILGATSPAAAQRVLDAFRDGLRERGYVEGQNLAIDFRPPAASFEPSPEIAAELAGSADVILAWTTPAVIVARRVTSTVPIVMVGVADPVGVGLVASLARPGANITGIANFASDLSGGKTIELLMEIAPGIRRLGVVRNPDNPGVTVQLRQTEAAARALGLELQVADARVPAEFEIAFAQLREGGVQGVVLLPDSTVLQHARKIAELAQQARLPTVFQRRENVDAGGLLSYGPSLRDAFRQAAGHVDRILKGAKPADIPVEQPTKLELIINLKTAKALGLDVPWFLQQRADEVIE